MSYDVTYNADFNILATITSPLFKSTDPNIKLDTNATAARTKAYMMMSLLKPLTSLTLHVSL